MVANRHLGMRQPSLASLPLEQRGRRCGQQHNGSSGPAAAGSCPMKHGLAGERVSVKLIDDDQIERFLKAQQLMGCRQHNIAALPALRTASVKRDYGLVGEGFADARVQLKDDVPPRRSQQCPPASPDDRLQEGEHHLRLARPRYRPEQKGGHGMGWSR